MRFCPKCGTLMVLKEEKKKTYYICPKCKYKEVQSENTVLTEDLSRNNVEVFVIEEKIDTLPKVSDISCPKCGNTEAYYWTYQTRAADEAETRFYRCTKCGYTWREYD